jgi:CubicO group peptidase (beta-lactamase class C family)
LGGYLRNLDNNEADNALEASFLDLGSTKLNALPGERFEYSNTNYDLLGLLIQNASGEPYEVFIKERIFLAT